MEKIRLGVIGCGQRGMSMIEGCFTKNPDTVITAVCDRYEDRSRGAAEKVKELTGEAPFAAGDYREVLNPERVDAVYIATAWDSHIEISIAALEAGIPTAMEVGGAYDLDSLWKLVSTWERTRTPFMMMENCCFGREELLATAMVRGGLLGEIVHASGCYAHCLHSEIAGGHRNRHYRLDNYLNRNCENYPTHELGPIARVLNINRGNRMVSLVSVASRAVGMESYINEHSDRYPELVGKRFAQGDIVNTLITCADGSTISLRLDTTLPRFYAREFTLHGTKGLYEQNTNTVFFEGGEELFCTADYLKKNIGNAQKFEEEYLPEVWKDMTAEKRNAVHGGMDGVEWAAFVKALKNGEEMPIDVYDAASWMCISALSEASIAAGGMPQTIPDFTRGGWVTRKPEDVMKL